jgi:hypothetical protein
LRCAASGIEFSVRETLHEGRQEMKRKSTTVVLAAAICLALQAQVSLPGGTGDSSHEGTVLVPGQENVKPGTTEPLPAEPEARAEELRQRGQCRDAIPIFRQLAAKGDGYEIAEFNLGLCLFDVSKTEADAQRAASLKHEAAECIEEAANNGFPNAQFSLVVIYLDGYGTASDPVEAGKWSLIYHDNSMRVAIGLPDISPELQARLDSVLTDKSWAEAQSRAAAWSPAAQDSDSAN